MKPPGETKYTGPCVHQFGQDTRRRAEKFKRRFPSALRFLLLAFADGVDMTVYDLDLVPNVYWVLQAHHLVTSALQGDCSLRFELTPFGSSALRLEGK